MKQGLILVALFCLALIPRVGAIALLHAPATLPTSAYEHGSIARHLVEGRGFSFEFYGPPGQAVPTSHQAPLVSYVLATAYVLFGTETATSFWFVLLIQSTVASAAVVALAEAVRLASGRPIVGWTAGVVGALYPPLVVSVCHVQAVTWNISALAFLLWGWLAIREGSTKLGIPIFTLASLVAWHADPILGGVSVLMLLALGITPGVSWKSVAITGLLMAIGLAPWSARNYVVHGRFVAMKDSFWYVFWQGNTAASHGTDKLALGKDAKKMMQGRSIKKSVEHAQAVREKAVSIDSTLPEAARRELLTIPREIDRMPVFKSLILAELSARPMQYVEKSLLRLRQWLWFDETNPRSYVFAYRACYVALVGLAAVGLGLERRRWRSWTPMFVAAGGLTMLHVMVITSARFRLPVELLLVPFAAVCLVAVMDRMIARQPSADVSPPRKSPLSKAA